MKKIALVIFSLLAVSFAASDQASIAQALIGLEKSTKGMVGGLSMLSLLVGVVLAGIGAAIHFMKVKKMERPGNWKLASMVLMALGALGLVGGIVGIILYVLTPVLIKSLMGV